VGDKALAGFRLIERGADDEGHGGKLGPVSARRNGSWSETSVPWAWHLEVIDNDVSGL
jgi:hypothetical protein